MSCVALLAPVAVFIATAVRFGGERRDRRLAALRLVGADPATTRRIAAGEALAGALFGLLTGAALFLRRRSALRHSRSSASASSRPMWCPMPRWPLLIALAVPLVAVGVTLFTMRRVTVEPLGVPPHGSAGAPPAVVAAAAAGSPGWRCCCRRRGAVRAAATPPTRPGDRPASRCCCSGSRRCCPGWWSAVVARLDGAGRRPSWHLAVRRLQLSSTAGRPLGQRDHRRGGRRPRRTAAADRHPEPRRAATRPRMDRRRSARRHGARRPCPGNARPAARVRRRPRRARHGLRLRGLRPPPPGPGAYRARRGRRPRAVSGDRRRLRHPAPTRRYRRLFPGQRLPRQGPRGPVPPAPRANGWPSTRSAAAATTGPPPSGPYRAPPAPPPPSPPASGPPSSPPACSPPRRPCPPHCCATPASTSCYGSTRTPRTRSNTSATRPPRSPRRPTSPPSAPAASPTSTPSTPPATA